MTLPDPGVVSDSAVQRALDGIRRRFPLGGQDLADDAITGNHVAPNAIGASEIGSLPSVRAYNNADLTISNNTETALTFNSERWDTDTIHNTGSNTSRLTCKTAGVYAVFGHAHFDANATGRRYMTAQVNGSTASRYAFDERLPVTGALQTPLHIATQIKLAVNDYVELVVYQNSGGNLAVKTAFSAYTPEFGMSWMGDG